MELSRYGLSHGYKTPLDLAQDQHHNQARTIPFPPQSRQNIHISIYIYIYIYIISEVRDDTINMVFMFITFAPLAQTTDTAVSRLSS